MESTKGSEWRRWELHIHTPDTQKNDNFTGSSSEEKWKKYLHFTKLSCILSNAVTLIA